MCSLRLSDDPDTYCARAAGGAGQSVGKNEPLSPRDPVLYMEKKMVCDQNDVRKYNSARSLSFDAENSETCRIYLNKYEVIYLVCAVC